MDDAQPRVKLNEDGPPGGAAALAPTLKRKACALHLAKSLASLAQSSGQPYHALVWRLVDALWGPPLLGPTASQAAIEQALLQQQDATDPRNRPHVAAMARRRAFSKWLAEAAAYVDSQRTDGEVLDADKEERALQDILSRLACHDLKGGCSIAMKMGDMRLAMLISQAGGPLETRSMIREQLEDWFERKADNFISPTRRKIYALLAGCLVWPESPAVRQGHPPAVAAAEGLHWLQALGLCLWYATPVTSSIKEAVDTFGRMFRQRMPRDASAAFAAAAPVPHYAKAPAEVQQKLFGEGDAPSASPVASGAPPFDILFHLLYAFTHWEERSFEALLATETHTKDRMDARLSWQLYGVLHGLGFGKLVEERECQLHVEYASRLEEMGCWPWAAYVLAHLPEDGSRAAAVRALYLRNSLVAPPPKDFERVHAHLKTPSSWRHLGQALHAQSLGDWQRQREELLLAGHVARALEVTMTHLASPLLSAGAFASLETLLEGIISKGSHGKGGKASKALHEGAVILYQCTSVIGKYTTLVADSKHSDVNTKVS